MGANPTRPFNFAAGPATLPLPVLEQARAELCDWRGSGMSVMEMSHRGAEFAEIMHATERDLRQLADVPDDFAVLFMQGGGLAENAIVPLNLVREGQVDVAVTGSWSAKSAAEAKRYAEVNEVCNTVASSYTQVPPTGTWRLSAKPDYVHICGNETIDGTEFHELPDLVALGCSAPLVVDCSSNQLSRPMDWSRVGLAFGGAQKNIGPAGLTLVYVRRSLLGKAHVHCPSAFEFDRVAREGSLFNTPPTFAIYMAGLVFQWALAFDYAGLRGLAALERQNIDKASLLYSAIDASALYVNHVEASARSRMNVPFFLRREALTPVFLAEAKSAGFLQLKGHKSKGGLRASLYNAMPLGGVQALVAFMKDFENRHG